MAADDDRRAEIEAVARAMYEGAHRRWAINPKTTRWPGAHKSVSFDALDRGIRGAYLDEAADALAALGRVRNARDDDEPAKRIVAWLRSFKSPLVAPNDDAPKLWLAADYIEREFSDAARSPQALLVRDARGDDTATKDLRRKGFHEAAAEIEDRKRTFFAPHSGHDVESARSSQGEDREGHGVLQEDNDTGVLGEPRGEDYECGCGARKGEPCYLDTDGPQYHALREMPAPQDSAHEIAARRAAHEAAQDWVDAAGGDEVDTGHVVDEALNAYLSRVSSSRPEQPPPDALGGRPPAEPPENP